MSFNISYIFNAVDKFSAPARKMASSIKLSTDKLKKASKAADDFGRSLAKAGRSLSLKMTAPIAGFFALSLRGWSKQQQAIGQVESALLSTENTAGRTLKQLESQASSLQDKTIFGDESILQGVTAQLLTFTNISGKAFDRTQKAVLDVTSRLNGANASADSLRSVSIQLGKALNAPVQNLSALSRSGIQFTEQQKATIKALVETNRLADAQAMILDELEKQYGGAAEAIAKKGLGPLRQLTNQLGDVMEQLGGTIAAAILPYVPAIKRMVKSFSEFVENNPRLIKMMVVFGGILAVMGPILLSLSLFSFALKPIIGSVLLISKLFFGLKLLIGTVVTPIIGFFGLLSRTLPFLKILMAAAFSPIGIAVIAIAGLIALGVTLFNKYKPFRNLVLDTVDGLKMVGGFIKDTFLFVGDAIARIMFIIHQGIEGIVNVVDKVKNVMSSIVLVIQNGIVNVANKVKGVIDGVILGIQKGIEGIINVIEKVKKSIAAVKEFFTGGANKPILAGMAGSGVAPTEGAFAAPQPSFLGNAPLGFAPANINAFSQVDININDRAKAVESVQTRSTGIDKLNVGRNMAGQ